MKGSLLWKLAYIFCALAGVLAGYGIALLSDAGQNEYNRITKDNTLVREDGDGVFFDAGGAVSEQTAYDTEIVQVSMTPTPTAVPEAVATEPPVLPGSPSEQPAPPAAEEMEVLPELPEITMAPEETVSAGQAALTVPEDELPSLASQWAGVGTAVMPKQEQPEVRNMATETAEEKTMEENALPQDKIQETITYPAKIFGQTPIINRSDAYVSYFEFCYDLIAMVEQEVEARGLNLNALMAKFTLKALFCGVDIEQLDINAPIPRRLAALCLWLAAQVLNENGCDTSSKTAERYVTDISLCTVSERKAIAYLYEQGIIKGYQTAGQKFYPEDGLKTEAGKNWLLAVKQCWK